jgi:hypothetical protein
MGGGKGEEKGEGGERGEGDGGGREGRGVGPQKVPVYCFRLLSFALLFQAPT